MLWCQDPLSKQATIGNDVITLTVMPSWPLKTLQGFKRKGIKVSRLRVISDPANFKAPGCLWKYLPIGIHTSFRKQMPALSTQVPRRGLDRGEAKGFVARAAPQPG